MYKKECNIELCYWYMNRPYKKGVLFVFPMKLNFWRRKKYYNKEDLDGSIFDGL